ncbi:MAG TPA: ArsB/NhaD family transporter [Chloroflexota bacterium]
MTGAEAVVVAALTLALVVARPRGLNEGVAALLGGALVLLLGLVPIGQALELEAGNWNIFLFFAGMMAIAALADQSGVFDLVAFAGARLARGRVGLLYVAVFLLGAIISLLFANDSAALVLTPIVYALVVRLALDPLPFVFAITFVADTASMGLPVSNPLNVILADRFHLGLAPYVSHLWLPALLVVAVNFAVFLVLFRRHIGGRFQMPERAEAGTGLVPALIILSGLACAYLVASALELPLGVVAIGGAAALAVDLRLTQGLDMTRLGREISWPIFGFIAGMLLVVQGLQTSGVTAALGRALGQMAGGSAHQAIAVTVLGTALGSNVINNLPMALVMASTIHSLHVSSAIRTDMVYATVAGCDLGPNLTHLGSLATFLWLFFLRRKGLDVSTGDYFRLGIVVTPLMLAAAILGLWLVS